MNSLLFAYLAMAAFVISQLERFFTGSENFRGRHRLIALGSIFSLCSVHFFFSIKLSRSHILFLRLAATTNTSALLRWQGS